MAVQRVTTKGQVTIPRAIRSAMGIGAGDGVIFVMEGARVLMVPIKRRSLTELYGSLRVNKRLDRAEELRIAHDHVAKHVLAAGQTNGD